MTRCLAFLDFISTTNLTEFAVDQHLPNLRAK